MSDNGNFLDEDKIPKNWEAVEADAVVPSKAPALLVPNEMPQFFSGSMPPSLQHDVAFVGTEVGSPRIPKYSLMPFGNQANPFTNAASQSTTIQAPPSSGTSSPVVSLSIPNIFTPTLQTESSTGLLEFALAVQPAHYVLAGASGTILDDLDALVTAADITTGISISATPSQAEDFAIVFTAQDFNAATTFAPDASWTSVIAPGTHQSIYAKVDLTTDPVTASGVTDPAFPAWCSLLAMFGTNGSTPVVVNSHTVQSGAFSSVSASIGFTPTANNSLLVIIMSSDTNAVSGPAAVVSFDDNHGDEWVILGQIANNSGDGVQAILYGVSEITGGSTTISVVLNKTIAAANIVAMEVTNLAPLANMPPKFRPLVGGDIPPIHLDKVNVNGGVTGVLAPSSLPTDIAYVDLANVFTTTQTFQPSSSVPPALFFGQFSSTTQVSQFANLYVRYDLYQGGLTTPWTNYTLVCAGASTFPAFAIALAAGTTANAIDAYAPGSASVKNFSLTAGGLFSRYAGQSTVAQGVPAEYAQSDLTAQSAAISATTLLAAPTTGMYRISWSADITTADLVSSTLGGLQVLFTSPTDSVVKTTKAQADWSSTGNTTGTAVGGTMVVYALASTNIQFTFGYVSNTPGQMVYELHIKVEAM